MRGPLCRLRRPVSVAVLTKRSGPHATGFVTRCLEACRVLFETLLGSKHALGCNYKM